MGLPYKAPFIFVFSLLMIWDVVTTGLGVIKILEKTNIGSVSIAVLFAFAIWSLNFYSSKIMETAWDDLGDLIRGYSISTNKFMIMLRPFCIGALIFDFYTSWQGNENLLGRNYTGMANIMIIFFTLLTTISPMTVYWLYHDDSNKYY